MRALKPPISETSSLEPRRTFPFRQYDDGEKYEESLGRESPEPRRLFTVHQYHSTLYGHPQPALQMKTFCPGPLRRFLTPEGILKLEAFDDCVRMHMSEGTTIDASPGKHISETSSPEPRRLFPFRHEIHVIEYDDDEKDDELFEAGPAPRRLFPVHQSHSTLDDPHNRLCK